MQESEKNQIISELTRLNESKLIEIQDTDKKRRVFIKSTEMFNIFGGDVLEPFNDYTYEWLNSFLYNVVDLLNSNDIEDYNELEESITDNISEWTDSETDIYTSNLTEWLNEDISNTYYLDEASKEGFTENLLGVAQFKAIEETFYNSIKPLMDYLKENHELKEEG